MARDPVVILGAKSIAASWPIATLLACVSLLGCSRAPDGPVTPGERSGESIVNAETIGSVGFSVPLCSDQPLPRGELTAQVLVDASGSMTGFSKGSVIGPLIQLAERASSGLGTSDFRIRHSRGLAFNRSSGFQQISTGSGSPAYSVGSNTNLDEAVSKAAEADLTIILTDGVPFGEAKDSKDCGSGADTGCVARRLLEYVAGQPSCGIWIIPIIAAYDGPLSTEGQPVPAEREYAGRVLGSVRAAFPNAPVDLQLKSGAGEMKLRYSGPRSLLAIVVAKQHQIGRAYVGSLMENIAQLRLGDLGDAPGGYDSARYQVGVLTPVELFPGKIPDFTSVSARELADRSPDAGTIDFRSVSKGGTAVIELECLEGETGQLPVRIEMRFRDRAGCPVAYVAPFIQLSFGPSVPQESSISPSQPEILRNLKLGLSSGGYDVDALLVCGDGGVVPCETPRRIEVLARPSYIATADGLSEPASSKGLAHLLQIATENLPEEPYKVLGLPALLRQVFRGLPAPATSDRVASVELCASH